MRLALLFALATVSAAVAQPPTPSDPVVFAYFKEPGTQGIYLALSRDGYSYTPLNDGQPWLVPSRTGELMRDIFITRTPDGHGFRAVWTWAWHGNSFGTASSTDLIHWSAQREVKIMETFPDVQNTWAPETYWDPAKQDWLVIWSSSFKPADPSNPADIAASGLRIWAARTKDFETFTRPEKFLDRGFPAIDATMFHRTINGSSDVVLVLKDQTSDPLAYDERWVSGPTVEGPWGPLSGPVNESWSEGSSVLQIGDRAVVFYDHYRPPHPRFEAVETTDWIHWTSANDKIHLPEGSKHGSFFRVTPAEAAQLQARHDSAPVH